MIPSGIVLLTVGACLLEQTPLVSIDWENSKIGFCMYEKNQGFILITLL